MAKRKKRRSWDWLNAWEERKDFREIENAANFAVFTKREIIKKMSKRLK